MLAGFPALTTLDLSYVTIPSYGAFQRMLAAAPALRRLHVSPTTLTSTNISPTIQYFQLRCPSLKKIVWCPSSSPSSEQSNCAVFAHLIRNLHVCKSLEDLDLGSLNQIVIDKIIASVTSNRYPVPFILPNLSTLSLHPTILQKYTTQEKLSGLLKSITRLIATLWPSGTYAQRRRTLTLEFWYPRGTLNQVTDDADSGRSYALNPTEDILERLLRALKAVSAELEHVFATVDGAGSTVEFLFDDLDDQDVPEIAEVIYMMRCIFVVSLHSRVVGIFPELHRRGILSVKFGCWIQGRHAYYEWVKDDKGNFDIIQSKRRRNNE
ncbi:hypothetical protein C8T65DRAFT_657261 [Cerioporus squamosus]|nr:hypothetical protein C8T65DRAFT_657261 [Cerioporus squamosus]